MQYVLLTITGWNEPPRARHQVAQALTEHGHVVFIEKNRTGAPGLAEKSISDNLTVITPSWPLSYRIRYRMPGINEIYQNWLLRRLRQRYPKARVIAFDHTPSMLHRYFPGYVYFCNDDFIGNGRVHFYPVDRYHQKTESSVAKHASLVVATSAYLTTKLKRFNPNTHELNLGAPEISDDFLARHTPPRQSGRLVLGLMGYLDFRMPASTLNRLLKLDSVELNLIGPASPGFIDQLSEPDKINYLGIQKDDELYASLCKLDVGLAPYDLALSNKGATPNKLWQYLAVGKAVVVTDMPNIRNWEFPEGCVYRANSDTDFVEQVERAIAEDNDHFRKARIAFARENTWSRRVKDLFALAGW